MEWVSRGKRGRCSCAVHHTSSSSVSATHLAFSFITNTHIYIFFLSLFIFKRAGVISMWWLVFHLYNLPPLIFFYIGARGKGRYHLLSPKRWGGKRKKRNKCTAREGFLCFCSGACSQVDTPCFDEEGIKLFWPFILIVQGWLGMGKMWF
jgi:hypothetical protein